MTTYAYDATGALFNYFLLVGLLIVLVPGTLMLKKRRLYLFLGWVLFFLVCYRTATTDLVEEKTWDPYEILGVSMDDTPGKIKKQYYKLSLKYHPDKVKEEDKKDAEKMYIDISKAYKVLTDEEAKKMWDEFGHPDGKQAFQMGVALPQWLVQPENANLVLLVYGLVFGLGLPLVVARWWNKQKKVSKNTLLNITMTLFYKELRDDYNHRLVYDLLVKAPEFQHLVSNKKDAQYDQYLQVVKEAAEKHGKFEPKTNRLQSRTLGLIYGYLLRVPCPEKHIQADQKQVILQTEVLLQGMLQIAVSRNWLMLSSTVLNCLQQLTQALYLHQSPLLQLGITQKSVKKFNNSKVNDVEDFLNLSEKERTKLLSGLEESEKQQLEKRIQDLPQLHVINAEYKVLGEPAIIPSAIVTLSVKIGSWKQEKPEFDPSILDPEEEEKQKWFESKKQESNVYAPYYPQEKKPGFWVGLANVNMQPPRLITMGKVYGLDTPKTVRLQFQAPPQKGKWTFTIVVKSDSYLGLDKTLNLDLVVDDPQVAPLEQEDDDISEPDEIIGGNIWEKPKIPKELRTEFDDSSDSDNED
ncbi:Sec63 Brl domain-containing protein [Gorgonomyces haynaldii]|nr:Sec63 Brl domain-containing protein [Gorgonomyces haynaldii]